MGVLAVAHLVADARPDAARGAAAARRRRAQVDLGAPKAALVQSLVAPCRPTRATVSTGVRAAPRRVRPTALVRLGARPSPRAASPSRPRCAVATTFPAFSEPVPDELGLQHSAQSVPRTVRRTFPTTISAQPTPTALVQRATRRRRVGRRPRSNGQLCEQPRRGRRRRARGRPRVRDGLEREHQAAEHAHEAHEEQLGLGAPAAVPPTEPAQAAIGRVRRFPSDLALARTTTISPPPTTSDDRRISLVRPLRRRRLLQLDLVQQHVALILRALDPRRAHTRSRRVRRPVR